LHKIALIFASFSPRFNPQVVSAAEEREVSRLARGPQDGARKSLYFN
jgi:hypothetical protein